MICPFSIFSFSAIFLPWGFLGYYHVKQYQHCKPKRWLVQSKACYVNSLAEPSSKQKAWQRWIFCKVHQLNKNSSEQTRPNNQRQLIIGEALGWLLIELFFSDWGHKNSGLIAKFKVQELLHLTLLTSTHKN